MSENKITTTKIFETTKEKINKLDLGTGNQQEKLDILVDNYNKFINKAKNYIKEDVNTMDFTEDISTINTSISNLLQGLNAKINNYIVDTINANTRNIEIEINRCHEAFYDSISDLKVNAELIDKKHIENDNIREELVLYKAASKLKEGENTELLKRISELEIELSSSNAKVSILEKDVEELYKYKEECISKDEEIFKLKAKNNSLLEELKPINGLNIKYKALKDERNSLISKCETLENTLNIINSILGTVTESKVEAEETSIRLTEENSKLKEELKALKGE